MTLAKFGCFSLSALVMCLQMGCGGGGSSDKAADGTTQSSAANNTDYSAVAGLYDASLTSNSIKDEAYLYIDSAGKITAYNYLGDSKDLGGNCYSLATGANINASITGKTLSFSGTENQFSTTSGTTPISWVLDSSKNLTKISYGGSITSSRISITSGGTSIVVDSKKITTPALSDITTMLCK
jgi:hypothetical protein